MNARALTVQPDLAAARSTAANKAWATRRAQAAARGETYTPQRGIPPGSNPAIAEAFAEFERAGQSDMPDWHGAALKLKNALALASQPGGCDVTVSRPRRQPRPAALPAPVWPDYPVDRVNSFNIRNPTIVVTFADGIEVRAPAVSAKGKPVNIGRGLRVAIAFYVARICRQKGLRNLPGTRLAVPEITSCLCEDTGETYDPAECTARSIETRRAQDWKIKRQ